jgi:hypothetical protein
MTRRIRRSTGGTAPVNPSADLAAKSEKWWRAWLPKRAALIATSTDLMQAAQSE